MNTVRRHLIGALIAVASAVVLLQCLLGAWVVDGRGGPDMQCYRAAATSYRGLEQTEATQYRGDWTVLPLGLHCTADNPHDRRPPTRETFDHWDLTITAAAAVVIGLVGAALLITPTPIELRRLTAAFRG